MVDKVHTIHSLPGDSPWQGGLPPAGSEEHPRTIRALDRVLAIQRPVVLAHLRSIRLRHPDASTADLVRILERRYLAAVTAGGAAVGATAVVPGIGTGVTLALSGIETVGFIEATALFAQSVAEVHGIPVADPDRARALVLTLMLGKEGVDLVSQLAGQAMGRGPSRDKYWGELITKTIPRAAMGPIVDRLKTTFIHQFAVRGGASWIGKALPFGIGAAIGGTGNHLLGRRVLVNSRRAFGQAPAILPPDLEPKPGATPLERAATRTIRHAGEAVMKGAKRLRPGGRTALPQSPAGPEDLAGDLRRPPRAHNGRMGLFTRGPEHNEEWAGLPSEPARPESDAERLADATPVRLDGFGGDGGAVESIVIPVTPIVDIAQPDVTDGDSED